MRAIMLYGMVLATLAACGGPPGPEYPKVYENMDVTQRVDILTGGHGSSVVLTTDGYLLTCFHVSGRGESKLGVNISENGKPAVFYPARVVATDEKHDLALLKVDRTFEETAVLGDIADVHPLDAVYNIGYPYGLGRMAGRGDVKYVHWDYQDEGNPDLKIENGLALDIPNGPGTSGSGIYLARSGKLIGLMQMSIIYGARARDGTPISDGRQVNVHVAIPIDVIRAFLDRTHVPYHTEFKGSEAP